MPPPTRYQRDRAAGVVVFRRAEAGCQFLLLRSRRTRRPLWEFPKGGVNAGETLLQAALRELREETGLTPEEIRLVPAFRHRETYRFDLDEGARRTTVRKQVTYFLAETSRAEIVLSPAETSAYAWLSLETAMRRVRYTGRRRMLEEAAALTGCASPTAGAF